MSHLCETVYRKKSSQKTCTRNINNRVFFSPADIYDDFKKSVKPDELNVTTRIMGGGWLEHGDKSILVEGASVVSTTTLTRFSSKTITLLMYNKRIKYSEET